MRIRFLFVVVMTACTLVMAARAADRASLDDAKAMAAKAARYLEENGASNAFVAFDAKDGPWHDRDLYVFVIDGNGEMLAHGVSPALVGKNLATLKDVEGKPFMREMIAVKDAGWVDYKWQNPVTRMIEAKASYMVRVGQYCVGVGAYK